MPARANTPQPTGIATRAFTPVRNPVYASTTKDGSWKQTRQPGHVLEGQQGPQHTDPRLTSAGSMPPVTPGSPTILPVIAYAGQTPHNVWELFPA